jgi:hypothetical protein
MPAERNEAQPANHLAITLTQTVQDSFQDRPALTAGVHGHDGGRSYILLSDSCVYRLFTPPSNPLKL